MIHVYLVHRYHLGCMDGLSGCTKNKMYKKHSYRYEFFAYSAAFRFVGVNKGASSIKNYHWW